MEVPNRLKDTIMGLFAIVVSFIVYRHKGRSR